MSLFIQTKIRQHLQANDAVQDPIDFEEIVSRLEVDEGFVKRLDVDLTKDRKEQRGVATDVGPARAVASVAARRGILVAAASAVITLLLLGLIQLFSGSEEIPPADTSPPPTTPTSAVPQSTIGDTEPRDEGGVVVPQVFTTVPSDPIAVQGSLTWRTVELPAPGVLTVGLDDRIYLLTEDVVWVSDDGVDWTGYPAVPPHNGYWSAVGQDRLISAGGGGGIGDSEADKEPDVLMPVTVSVYDLSDMDSGGMTRISQVPLPGSEGDGANSVAIAPQGAVVATSRSVYYSEDGDQWTAIEGLPPSDFVIATSDGFYSTDGTTLFFSTDGMEWAQVHEPRRAIRAIGRWGDSAVADDGETIWRLTPRGVEALYTNADRTGTSDWIWQITGSTQGIMSVHADTGRYLYSRDGVDWEDMPLPEGWILSNVFIEEPIVMNGETILVIATTTGSQDGDVFEGNRVLMATP